MERYGAPPGFIFYAVYKNGTTRGAKINKSALRTKPTVALHGASISFARKARWVNLINLEVLLLQNGCRSRQFDFRTFYYGASNCFCQ